MTNQLSERSRVDLPDALPGQQEILDAGGIACGRTT
ncbi:hypothetical protein QF050_000679 [Arthrobacter sp. SLBN-112]|nr:hypothetical protein [Arthrobacter sp. SLBN-112]